MATQRVMSGAGARLDAKEKFSILGETNMG